MNKKVISIVLVLIVFCSSLGALGYSYMNLNNRCNSLQSEYATLEKDYHSLDAKYNNLNSKYQILFADYNAFSNVFNNPLQDKEVPTVEELQRWLSEDKTNEIQYNYPDFICGDFAVMLSQHAKLEHWDIGIVVVIGYDENYDSYGHAFNAIITTEGLRYVEPQNDYFWHFSDGSEILKNHWNEIGINRERIYVLTYMIILRFE